MASITTKYIQNLIYCFSYKYKPNINESHVKQITVGKSNQFHAKCPLGARFIEKSIGKYHMQNKLNAR